MENQIPFTGILSNKPEENPGFSLDLKHACIFLPVIHLNSSLLVGCNLSIFKPVFFHFCACNLPRTDFFNWNRVKLRYCDGASFSGDSEDEVSERNILGFL